jgi:hypothetical protein
MRSRLSTPPRRRSPRRRGTEVVLLILTALLVTNLFPSIGATHSAPMATSPQILSSAPPYLFANESFAYVLSSSEAANWTCIYCPYFALLVVNPSSYASLRSSTGVPFNGSQHFAIKAQMGSATVYQNWTPKTETNTTISTLPSFTANIGVFYSYAPVVVNPGTGGSWTFTGAPYLSLNGANGRVSGTPINDTAYTNVLTYSSSKGSWTQAWVTVPDTGTFPATLSFTATTAGHPLSVTLPTSALASVGSGMVWWGSQPLMNFGTGSDGYTFSFTGPSAYVLNWQSGTTTSKTLWTYGTNNSTPTVTVNGHALSLSIFPPWGYENTTLTPPPKVTDILVVTTTPDTVRVQWSNPAAAVADNLYYGLACGVWEGQENLSLSTTYTVSSLAPSTTYCVGVGAVSLAGQGPLNYTNGTTTALPPAADLVGKVYGSFVALTWVIPSVVTYTHEQVIFDNKSLTVCGFGSQSFPVTPPTADLNVSQPAGTYCVGVILYLGPYSSMTTYTNVTVAPINPPTRVLGVKATGIAASNFTVRWNSTARATSYEVLYGLSCGLYPSRVLVGNVTKANITGVAPLTTYCVVVEAFNETNGGPYSIPINVTTFGQSPSNGTSPPTPTPNPTPYPTPASEVTVVNLFVLGAVVVGGIVVALLYQYYGNKRRGGKK